MGPLQEASQQRGQPFSRHFIESRSVRPNREFQVLLIARVLFLEVCAIIITIFVDFTRRMFSVT